MSVREMSETTQEDEAPTTSWLKASALGIGVALLVGLFATAFLWPMGSAEPRDIELAIGGPEQTRQTVVDQLNAQGDDVFSTVAVEGTAEAVALIETREVHGAIVVGEQVEVLTTSAGSPQVAQLLTQLAEQMKAQTADVPQAPEVTVTDVVPAGQAGPAINMIMLPSVIGGIAGSVITVLVVQSPSRRFASLASIAVFTGLVGAAVFGPWFDILQGNYWAHAGAITMGILAIGGFITGLGTLFGKAGLGLGALTILLIGNPWGGLLVPREFLAEPMATIGAYMPNGTVVELLRSMSFFPEASTGHLWLILVVWALIGLVLLALGTLRPNRTTTHIATRDPELVA